MPNALAIVPNGTRPKVTETGNYLIIMDQMYNKKDLTCVSKKTCTFDNIVAGNNILNIYNHMYLTGTSSWGSSRHKRRIIQQDPYNPNRYYFFLNENFSNKSSPGSYMMCVEEYDNDIHLIYKVKYTQELQDIIDITENWIFVYARANNSPFGWHALYKINKTTGNNSQTISSWASGWHAGAPYGASIGKLNVLYKDSNKIAYIMNYWGYVSEAYQRDYSMKRFRFYVYDKNTNSLIVNRTFDFDIDRTYNEEFDDIYTNRSVQNFIMFLNTEYKLCEVWFYDPSNNDIVNTFTSQRAWGRIETPYPLYSPNGPYVQGIEWITDGYCYIIYYDAQDNNVPISQQFINVFQCHNTDADSETDTNRFLCHKAFTYYDRIPIDHSVVRSIVYNSDKTILLIGYNLSFEIYILNKETHLYESSDKIILDVVSAGFDMTDRLWYQKSDGSVYSENLDDPLIVTPEFEKIYYTYNNTNINTYIKFSAQSFSKKPAIGKYILTLSENAYFNQTNNQVLEINYNGNDDIEYPVTITGPKQVVCNIMFEKEW